MVWQQQKQDLLSRFGEAVGKAFEGILALAVPGAKGISAAVEQVFSGLAAANQDLKTGAVCLEPLKYDQASALVRLLGHLTKRPITLVIDAWEQSPDVEAEKKLVSAILAHPEDWPRVHVFIGLRPDRPPIDYVNQLSQDPAADVYDLPDMGLEETAERRRLVELLHQELPVTRDLADDDLIQLIDGYAGTLYHWMHTANREQVHSRDGLVALVKDALAQRYGEFDRYLAPLAERDGPAYALALRLALLHGLSDREEWAFLAPIVLPDGNTESLGRLQRLGILEVGDFPTYGHATRHAFVRDWFLARPDTLTLRDHTEELVRDLAAKIRNASPGMLPFFLGLLVLGETAERLGLSDDLRLLCTAPRVFFADLELSALDAELLLRRAQASTRCYPDAAALIAMALFNALHEAKQETRQETDLGHRDALLDELRGLQRQHPDDAAVRERLARGLLNTLNHAKQEEDLGRRDALLDELRGMQRQHPDDGAVREQLAMGLFNTLIDAKQRGDTERTQKLRAELQSLLSAGQSTELLKEIARRLANLGD